MVLTDTISRNLKGALKSQVATSRQRQPKNLDIQSDTLWSRYIHESSLLAFFHLRKSLAFCSIVRDPSPSQNSRLITI